MAEISRATSLFLDLFQCRPGPADLQRLGSITESFARLPWENLTKLLRKHAALEEGRATQRSRLRFADEVLDDHARFGAGGTCFSLTNALRRIVTDLGYRARPVMADMRHGANVHCALRVELDGRALLLDPGYLVAEPVPLPRERAVAVEQAGQRMEYRATEGGAVVELRTRNARGEERLRYRLRPAPVADEEFVRHWIASFDADGMRGLHLNRIDETTRLSAHDLNLRIDDGRDKSNLKLRDDWPEEVGHRFGIDANLARRAFEIWERNRCRGR